MEDFKLSQQYCCCLKSPGIDILVSASGRFEAWRYHPLQVQRVPVERGTILQNVRNHSPKDTGSFPKTLDS